MPELFGASYRRADLLRRVGRLEQVAGATAIREFEARVSRLAGPGGGGAPGENASNPKAVSRRWRP